MAEYYRTTPDEVRSSLEQQGGEGTIENNLRTRKSVEALIGKVKVVESEWIDEAAAAETADGSTEDKPKKATKKSPAKKSAKKAASKEG
jgi:hypothetical protein